MRREQVQIGGVYRYHKEPVRVTALVRFWRTCPLTGDPAMTWGRVWFKSPIRRRSYKAADGVPIWRFARAAYRLVDNRLLELIAMADLNKLTIRLTDEQLERLGLACQTQPGRPAEFVRWALMQQVDAILKVNDFRQTANLSRSGKLGAAQSGSERLKAARAASDSSPEKEKKEEEERKKRVSSLLQSWQGLELFERIRDAPGFAARCLELYPLGFLKQESIKIDDWFRTAQEQGREADLERWARGYKKRILRWLEGPLTKYDRETTSPAERIRLIKQGKWNF